MLENLPVLILKRLVLLPYQEVRIELNNLNSKNVIDDAINDFDDKLLIVCPNDTLETNPYASDLPKVGVLAKISKKMSLPNGNYRVIIHGLNRVKVMEYTEYSNNGVLECVVKRLYIKQDESDEEIALTRTLKNLISKYMESNPEASNSVLSTINNINDLDMLTDIITNYLPFDLKKKVSYVNEFDYIVRANNLVKDINVELEVINIETKIDDDIRNSFAKEQRDYILKQKINKLNKELGLNVDKKSEISEISEKLDNLVIPKKTKKKLLDEIKKYSYTSENNPDSNVIRTYIDTVLSLPWNKYSKDETNLKKIKSSLDKSHYGYDEIKTRILEFIAIKKNNSSVKSPILCLVGPPGTGKTTFAMSVSSALNREFIKISVGGMSDAAELTGHRRTYLGSSPGKIIQGLRKCETANPVILIDEVDKMSESYQGDPSAVLLDILDTSQNNQFVDNYIEEPFDLSKVIFILTANDIRNIPSALRDRLEVIEINSYTEKEKIDIAKKHILPLILNEYGLSKIKINDDVIEYIIRGYTKESGVRELERTLKKIIRNIIINELNIKSLTIDIIDNILGPIKYIYNEHIISTPGSVSSLGVTSYGGVIIPFEAIFTTSNNKIEIIGNVDDSVRESTKVSYNYVINNNKKFGIENKLINNSSILINALKYNIKKDGTSGGLAITTSIMSLLLNKKVSENICFTGEITLHGDILRVGSIKEKLIGAYNNGYEIVYVPSSNKSDVEQVSLEVKSRLDIRFVSNYDEVFNQLFKVNKKNVK